jgi:hypothetical protein
MHALPEMLRHQNLSALAMPAAARQRCCLPMQHWLPSAPQQLDDLVVQDPAQRVPCLQEKLKVDCIREHLSYMPAMLPAYFKCQSAAQLSHLLTSSSLARAWRRPW